MRHRLNFALLCLLAWAGLLLSASSAGAVVVKTKSGQRIGVLLPHGRSLPKGLSSLTPQAARTTSGGCDTTTDNGTLNYQCGPVVHSSEPYLIFWDPSNQLSTTSKQLMERYLTDSATAFGTGAGDVYGVTRQYFDGSGYANESQSFSSATQAITDTQPYPSPSSTCPATSPYTACVLDSQVQAELTRLISADNLPVGGVTTAAPVYFVVLPQATNECIDGNGGCAASSFCAYHSSFANGPSSTLYAIIPFAPFNSSPKGCQSDGTSVYQSPNNDQADQIIDNLSHEFSETVTDPLGSGWFSSSYGMEVGDLCEAYGPTVDPANGYDPNAYLPTLGGNASQGTLYDQLINGDEYYTQTEWSNGENDCKAAPASATVAPAFTSSSGAVAGTAVSFDPSSSEVAAGISSASWNFGDGTTSFSSGPLAATTHTFARSGSYTVKLTLVDVSGDVASVSHTVTVGSPPAASFSAPASAPVGQPVAFDALASSDPNQGGSISSYAWSFGDGTTATGAQPQHAYSKPGTYSATLTVTDNFGFVSTPVTKQITITVAAPVAAIAPTPARVLVGHPVSFDGAPSTDPNRGGSLVSFAWNFGDGALAAGAQAQHAYMHAGSFDVTLSVTDSYGLGSRAVTRIVAVLPTGKIISTRVRTVRRVRYLLVKVSQAGRVRLGRKLIVLKRPGTARFRLVLSRRQAHLLATHHRVRVRVTLLYSPGLGRPVKLTKRLTLH